MQPFPESAMNGYEVVRRNEKSLLPDGVRPAERNVSSRTGEFRSSERRTLHQQKIATRKTF